MRILRVVPATVVALVLACASGAAAEPMPASAALETATRLIPLLGSDQFSVRESTTSRMMQMGIEIKPALVAALDDSDMEIRARVRRILAAVVEADFQHRLALFAEDANDAKHYVLPGWTRFRESVGGGRTTRNLFVEMQRAEPDLMQALEEGREPAARMLETRVRLSQAAFNGRIGVNGAGLTLGNVAALLFVASDKNVPVSEDYASLVGNLTYHQTLRQAINSGPHVELLRKMLGAWIARDASQNLASQNLYLALQFNLKEGLRPAVRVLEQPGPMAHVKPLALLAIAKFGGKEHLRLAESQFGASDICSPRVDINGTGYTTQVRDVALYACLQLAGQDPKNFGFDRITQADQAFMQLANIGFRGTAERDGAFKKWNDWRATNLQSLDAKKPAGAKS